MKGLKEENKSLQQELEITSAQNKIFETLTHQQNQKILELQEEIKDLSLAQKDPEEKKSEISGLPNFFESKPKVLTYSELGSIYKMMIGTEISFHSCSELLIDLSKENHQHLFRGL